MNSIVIGVVAWLAVQPLAVLAIFPLLRAASGREPAPEALDAEPSAVVDLALWAATHHRTLA